MEWLAESKPDVVCLQELRIYHEEFPLEAINAAGYGALWQGQKPRYNGVAILARGAEPVEVRRGLPGEPDDPQARYLEAAIDGIVVGCLYAPNGNPQPGPKFDYKLRVARAAVRRTRATMQSSGVPVVLAGDYNVVPTPRDIYPTTSYDKDALVQPESRAAFPQAGGPGMDRRDPCEASGRDDLHVLGLHAQALGARRRPAHRPPAAQSADGATPRRRGRRQGGARSRRRERSRADVDHRALISCAVGLFGMVVEAFGTPSWSSGRRAPSGRDSASSGHRARAMRVRRSDSRAAHAPTCPARQHVAVAAPVPVAGHPL